MYVHYPYITTLLQLIDRRYQSSKSTLQLQSGTLHLPSGNIDFCDVQTGIPLRWRHHRRPHLIWFPSCVSSLWIGLGEERIGTLITRLPSYTLPPSFGKCVNYELVTCASNASDISNMQFYICLPVYNILLATYQCQY